MLRTLSALLPGSTTTVFSESLFRTAKCGLTLVDRYKRSNSLAKQS